MLNRPAAFDVPLSMTTLSGTTVAGDHFGEECGRCRFITSFGLHEIKVFAALINRSIEIRPATFNLHVGLIHPQR